MPLTYDDLVNAALVSARKRFPKVPKVVELRHSVGVDSTGDNAVWVWVILDDATPKAQLSQSKLEPIREAIRSSIREQAPNILYVTYVLFRTKSEQESIDAGAG